MDIKTETPKIMKFAIFRRTHNKKFHHIPIYYNEADELIKEMEENANVDKGIKKSTDYHETIKGSMRRFQHNHISAASFAKNEKKRSNMRIIVILAILFSLAYLLWTHTDTFVEAFITR